MTDARGEDGQTVAVPVEDCCHCEKCGHIQVEPNWCHECGHRVTMPEWAKEMLAEHEAEREARQRAEGVLEQVKAIHDAYWENDSVPAQLINASLAARKRTEER